MQQVKPLISRRIEAKESVMGMMGIAQMDSKAKYVGLSVIWGRGKRAALAFIKEKISRKKAQSLCNNQKLITCFTKALIPQ